MKTTGVDARLGSAKSFEDLEAVGPGKLEVQQDQVRRLAAGDFEGLGAVNRRHEFDVLRTEQDGDELVDRRVVVDQ